jgi:glycosyltransferase involved in cell wall biosynthesis
VTALKVAVVAERTIGNGAAEAARSVCSLMRELGLDVRLFSAEAGAAEFDVGVPTETIGDWFGLYRALDGINSARRSSAGRDATIMEYHATRREVLLELMEKLASFGPDVVHFHNVSAVLSHLGALSVAARWPLVWTLHGRFVFDMFHNEWVVDGELARSWERRVADSSTTLGRDVLALSPDPIHFIAPSMWLRDLGRSSRLGANHRFHMVRNAISDRAPAGAVSGSKLKAALRVDRVLLLVIPNPAYTLKGFDVAEGAYFRARALLSHRPETSSIRIGMVVTTLTDLALSEGSLFTIPDLHRLGIVPHNEYLPQSLMRDLYGSADALLVPSRVENLPNVAVEALRDGCPLVATDVGGTSEVFGDADVGRLVDSESIEQMADAIIEVAVKRDRNYFRTSLARRWNEEFDQNRVAAETFSVYERAIDYYGSSHARRVQTLHLD